MDVTDLQVRLEELLVTNKVIGASLAVLHDKEITEWAVGTANLETGVPVTTDTMFQIGSTTKAFTATMIMQLVDEGKLDLDRPVRGYLPEFRVADPDVTERVTPRDLLRHTSGIQGDHYDDFGRGDDVLERFVAGCATLGQDHPLNSTMSYCNSGFIVLGRLIEVLTGQIWDTALRERLLDPLGLDHTRTLPEDLLRFRLAVGHVEDGDGRPVIPPVLSIPRSHGPAGIITARARDVLGFARVLLDEGRAADGAQVLSADAVRAMRRPEVAVPNPYDGTTHWGLGLEIIQQDGQPQVIGHGGTTTGQNSWLHIVPERSFAVSLLTNGGNSYDLAETILSEVLALIGVRLPVPPQPPEKAPVVDLTRYSGTYRNLVSELTITPAGDRLAATSTVVSTSEIAEKLLEAFPEERTRRFELLPISETLYVTREDGERTWTPVVFYEVDGRPYMHFALRAIPAVGRNFSSNETA